MSVTTSNPPPPRSRLRRLRRLAGWVLLLGVLAGGGFAIWFYVLGPQPPEVTGLENDPGAAQDVAEARSAVKLWPFRASKWGRLGLVLGAYGYEREAIVCFARAGQLDHSNPRWPYLEAFYQVDQDFDKGLPLLERSVQLDGSKPTPHLLLAETLLRVGRIDEAEKHLQFVLQQDPENARALLGMGQVADDRGDSAAGRDYLKHSASVAGQVKETHILLAKIYQRLGNQSQANEERRLAETLNSKTQWPDPYYRLDGQSLRGEKFVFNRAVKLMGENHTEEAIQLLKGLPQTGAGAVRTNLLLGRAYLRQGDHDAAVKAFEDGLRVKPDSVEVLFALGTTLEKHGDFAAAAEQYRKLIPLRPGDPSGHFHLGHSFEMQHKNTEALAEYKAAIRLRPGFAAAHKALGNLLQATGQDGEALAALDRACQLAPKDEETRRLRDDVRKRVDGSKDKDKKR